MYYVSTSSMYYVSTSLYSLRDFLLSLTLSRKSRLYLQPFEDNKPYLFTLKHVHTYTR